ncbi:MAG: NrfD/PsrC family molybdoenzyme membrane anchor subunit [Sutterella wadsworthensis]
MKSIVTGRFNGGSWMFIGICLLTVLCIACCVQLLLAWKSAEKAEALLNNHALLVFNAALGFAATAYSGFLLTQAEGVALWNTAVLPVLWIASGLSCAVGLVEILESRRRLPHAGWIGTTAVLAHLGEAFILFAFVHVAIATGTPGAVAGAESPSSAAKTRCSSWGWRRRAGPRRALRARVRQERRREARRRLRSHPRRTPPARVRPLCGRLRPRDLLMRFLKREAQAGPTGNAAGPLFSSIFSHSAMDGTTGQVR